MHRNTRGRKYTISILFSITYRIAFSQTLSCFCCYPKKLTYVTYIRPPSDPLNWIVIAHRKKKNKNWVLPRSECFLPTFIERDGVSSHFSLLFHSPTWKVEQFPVSLGFFPTFHICGSIIRHRRSAATATLCTTAQCCDGKGRLFRPIALT